MFLFLFFVIFFFLESVFLNIPQPSLVAQRIKCLPAMQETLGSIPGLGRSPGEGNGNPFQYSCLENPMDRGAWWATVHGVTKNQTRVNDFTFAFFPAAYDPFYLKPPVLD